MSLPLGAWNINANGFAGALRITNVDPQGNVTGTLRIGQEPPNKLDGVAFWDETSQKITFIRVINATNPSTAQIYTGYQFPANSTQPAGPSRLAGSFEAFAGTGGFAARVLYGWLASHA